ncbi:unnamed protein product [Rotaria sp. Silwood1]|nr:unnamed protein product [Rotaria sp. Silwood1]CAF4668629.1 unnamed protein product [Rotaria sp. Silwood1]
MAINEAMLAEMQHEAVSTRKTLERIPEDKFSWKPHEKSMTLGRLAGHTAEINAWMNHTINKDVLDFSKEEYKSFEPKTTAELLKFYDDTYNEAVEILKTASDEQMMQMWTLRNGETIYMTMPKVAVLRGFIMSHLIHHRAQLGVYLRMLDIPVPSVYGPSADEGNM